MVENVGRKVVLIAILVLGSLLALAIPWFRGARPFPMGLDIAGGTRLVYSFDIAEAKRKGAVRADASEAEIVAESIPVIRERLDNAKQTEAPLRPAGGARFEVQVPANVQSTGAQAAGKLGAALDADSAAPIALGGEEAQWGEFPAGGGVVAIDGEHIRYRQRIGNQLVRVERAYEDTPRAEHAVDASVVLINDDLIKNAIENLGDLHFYPNALDDDFRRAGTDQVAARAKLDEWLAKPENANEPIASYNALPPEQGGPPNKIKWFARRLPAGAAPMPLAQREMIAIAEQKREWSFEGRDLPKVYATRDRMGLPAVGFELSQERRVQFTEFTKAYVDKQMAIVLNDEVVTDPVINAVLPGSGIIEGGGSGFRDHEVREYVTVLKSGSLQIKPKLEQEEKVGASIGDDYVRRNMLAGTITLLVTMGFMVFYYRTLGMWACIALLTNLVMLMGAMVLTQSTLTLAGIAGIVLTVGMAIDANILIFDRIREEQEKGRKPAQAAKEGFQHALSAIVDGNLTTLITGIVLLIKGSGTIKGFAITLCLGILTSMFAALVVTRVLIHYQLKRGGVEKWHMRRWLADANFKFMSKAPLFLGISTLVVVVGLVGFLILPDTQKLGIDFLGGATVKVRTENALPVGEVRKLVEALPDELATAEVVDLPSSRDEAGNAREFRLTFKTDPSKEASGVERRFTQEVLRGLSSILQKGPIELAVTSEGATTTANAQLYFEKSHSPDDVKAALAGTDLVDPTVTQSGGRTDVFAVVGSVAAGTDVNLLRSKIEAAFTGTSDSGGRTFKLVGPLGESTVVGAQVVGELRDDAIIAIAISSLLILLYIRVRFAEYSYGFAALIADLHDLLLTLAVIALLVAVPGILNVEMNLTMIAAFLTILGYSLNDTIVVFDRIRENRPRVKGSLREIVDLSLNQTLSRTIVTGSTTIVATALILAFNYGTGNVLEGFAFALLFGVIAGTYSSLYVASPIFVWLEERAEARAKQREADRGSKPPTPAAHSATP